MNEGKMKSFTNTVDVDSNTFDYQVDAAQNTITEIFEAFEYLTSEIEPILLPIKSSEGISDKIKESEMTSAVISRLTYLNEKLYSLKYKVQHLPNYIQL